VNLFSNPELLRNARIQLRPGRMVAAAIICAVVSITIGYSTYYGMIWNPGKIFHNIMRLQIATLLIGGGIYTLLSIHREKELNTFDYQRVTRLTSLELALGKLFGAPILTYFIVLCFMPAAIVAIILGRLPVLFVLQGFGIFLVSSIAFHALVLLVSMTLGRGSSAIAILGFLILVAMTPTDYSFGPSNWMIRGLSPFAAPGIAILGSREKIRDIFFNIPISHFVVLMVIYFTLIVWFLLALRRNLKRDPNAYELYSPFQAFGFALYLNLLLIGFFNWKSPIGSPVFVNGSFNGYATLPPLDIGHTLWFGSFWIFALLGFVLLRNREQIRRRIQKLGKRGASLWAALCPAPYLLVGIFIVGGAIAELIRVYRHPTTDEWNWGLVILNVAFLALWLARDLLYLQWMNLRRTRRPLVSAVLYLIVFYVCASVILSVANISIRPSIAPFTAMLIPSEISSLEMADWARYQQLWLISLAVLCGEALVFAFLHWRKLREFIRPTVSVSVATPGSPVVQSTNSVLHL
jgi:hypothetical protein